MSTGSPDPWEKIRAALADYDAAFLRDRDPTTALEAVRVALRAGLPVPPGIATWLHGGLHVYADDAAASLNAALGLAGRGRSNPRRRRAEWHRLNEALGRMWWLLAIGATPGEAAELVAAVTNYSTDYLARAYRRSWHARRTDDPLAGGEPKQVRRFAQEVLADYLVNDETCDLARALLDRVT